MRFLNGFWKLAFAVFLLSLSSISAELTVEDPDFEALQAGAEAGSGWSNRAFQDATNQSGRYFLPNVLLPMVVYDSFTGLTWERFQSLLPVVWNQTAYPGSAQAHCVSLCAGGYSDWRVPSVMELQSLVDYSLTKAPRINAPAFPITFPSGYWSSEAVVNASHEAWKLSFGTGKIEPHDAFLSRKGILARCVRGPVPSQEDRFLDPSGSVLNQSSSEVLDTTTGFVWQRALSNFTPTSSLAEEYCDMLRLGGHKWQLPSIKQLVSLVDYDQNAPSLNSSVFPNSSVTSWSSTPSGPVSHLWAVHFQRGTAEVLNETVEASVRCVR
ncbi:MAG: DUF1566 domain-containing protein [Myxococcaceae bacterium]|nr:DUF1566 domain-containing protein [Myxococcaceae bacterium]MBH2005872.1 DUF1566 domain-containing protein [Myxococcaceae bacterium]